MSERDDGGPAFPVPIAEIQGLATHSGEFGPGMTGMSLRDYFAGQVIGMASHDLTDTKAIAQRAYAVADALIAERAK